MITLQIETTDGRLIFDLLDDEKTTVGQIVEVPGGFSLELEQMDMFKSMGIPAVLHFIVYVAKEADIGLLIAYLYEKVRGKEVQSFTVNKRTTTDITEAGIRQVIEEEIKIEKK